MVLKFMDCKLSLMETSLLRYASRLVVPKTRRYGNGAAKVVIQENQGVEGAGVALVRAQVRAVTGLEGNVMMNLQLVQHKRFIMFHEGIFTFAPCIGACPALG